LHEPDRVVEELFFTPEGRRNPYPHYHRLRGLAPVHRSEVLRAHILTGYEDCRAALRDPRFEKRYTEVLDAISDHWRDRPAVEWLSETMLQADPPAHTRLRRKVVRFFTPRTVQALRPRIEASVEQILDDFVDTAGGDLMDRVAFRLPITVICELLGIPADQGMAFREPTVALTAALEVAPTSRQLDEADRAIGEMYAALAPLLESKRAHPSEDLLSALVHDDDPLTPRELLNLTALLFVAGFETTTNLIGNGVLALLDQPEQWELLRRRPDLAPAVTDELLRHGGTVQLVSRVATEDVAFGDTVVPAGSPVLVVIGAANRDPARFPDPDLLDFTRTDIKQLSFGGGIHLCVGAALADLEVTVLLTEMAKRFERLELGGPRPAHRDRIGLRGAESLPLRLEGYSSGGGPAIPARPPHDRSWRQEFRAGREAGDRLEPGELEARVRLFSRIPLFAACTDAELARLAATAYAIAFDAGEVMIEQGSDSSEAYVVIEGSATVDVDGEVVATVSMDQIVGERGPVEGRARAATVTAGTHLLAYAVARDRLAEVMEANPAAAAHMRGLTAALYGTG
jgi:cytochrome P450